MLMKKNELGNSGGNAENCVAPVNIYTTMQQKGENEMHERKIQVEYNPDIEKLTRKKRVCAYARVSSDKDEAFHSLSAQISYYQEKIAKHPDWEFVEVFSDLGFTGTKEKREGFQRMLTACREGRIDIVLAKSITRFARNTVILLQTVRELRELGIDIHFEEEQIKTLSAQGELMISILAARAQEESRQASENQKWRYQKSYKKGQAINGRCLGYRFVNHQFVIDEDEAKTVRRIFDMYLSGKGLCAIARTLSSEGIKSLNGNTSWPTASISDILRCEKYCGDLILGKRFVNNHIEKKLLRNKGERPQYYVHDSHDAIIDRETFEKAQKEIKRRAERYGKWNARKSESPFFNLITCKHCGSTFYRKYVRSRNYERVPIWRSHSFDYYGKDKCVCRQVPEGILLEKAKEVLSIDNLDGVDLRNYFQKIIIPQVKKITFVFLDGTEKTVEWEFQSRRTSWTPEMREQARQYAAKRWRKEKENGS